ncbi:MAG: hypothetical protein KatS3mg095_0309 [Candidatus Parcubacteria bacterium]|nr:MAG: hypothetical protein KatS3mg095_0309 [Candidatus Parcubacteria bacterium]
MKNKIILSSIFIGFFFFVFLNYSYAQVEEGGLVGKNCTPQECTLEDFISAVQRLIRFLIILGYWIAAIVAVVGSFMMMFGGAKRDYLDKGRTMIINSITYYVLLLLAGVFFDLILDFLKPKVYTGY